MLGGLEFWPCGPPSSLRLTRNRLTVVAAPIWQLPNLETLELQGNPVDDGFRAC